MDKSTISTKQKVSNEMAKIRAEAAAQGKPPMFYLAEQSDDLRRMFIRWLEQDIKRLKSIKSTHA
jgi:hypothetical protein